MTKTVLDAALDAALDYIASRADLLTLCVAVPGTYADATTLTTNGGLMVARSALTEGTGGGDFSLGDGTGSGRRLSVAARALVAAEATGTANHLALVDQGSGTLMAVTELTEPVAMTIGTRVGIRSFGAEIADPV